MKYQWIWNNLQGFRFDKVSLNADSCQTAASTVSVCTSKEPELKDLKLTCHSQVIKMRRKWTANKKRTLFVNLRIFLQVIRIFIT